MGLFDKIKSAASAVTGGGAKVDVEVADVDRGTPIAYKVYATAKASLKISQVYLLVRSTEHAQYYEHHDREYEHASHVSFDDRVSVVEGPIALEAGQDYTWEGEFTLPEDVNPSFGGEIIGHVWEIQAGLDTVGNDPDSGWIEFSVY